MHEDDKQGILDVRILMNNLVEIDIEIQLAEELKEDSSDMLLWAKFIHAEKKEESESRLFTGLEILRDY